MRGIPTTKGVPLIEETKVGNAWRTNQKIKHHKEEVHQANYY